MIRRPPFCLSFALALFAVCIANLWAQHPASPANVAAIDSPAFLEKEKAVRHDFLQRHPAQLPGPLARYTAKSTAEDLFDFEFATVLGGKAEAPRKGFKPTYWQGVAAGLVGQIPVGSKLEDVMANAYWNHLETLARQRDDARESKLALQNMQSFKAIIAAYDPDAGQAFDAAPAAQKVRYILDAFLKLYHDIDSPCPFTVYLLDTDRYRDPDDEQPSVSREYVGRLQGRSVPDYLNFESYSREQKTAALMRTFETFLKSGDVLAQTDEVQGLRDYLRPLGFSISTSSTGWVLKDDAGRTYEDKDLIRRAFGQAELDLFTHLPEGPQKDSTRVAVILLTTQFHAVTAGINIG